MIDLKLNLFQYKATCYEAVVEKLVSNPTAEIFYEDYPEFEQRGHTVAEANTWLAYARMALLLMDYSGNINAKKAFARALVSYLAKADEATQKALEEAAKSIEFPLDLENLPDEFLALKGTPIINYRLFPEEKEIILNAEKLGRGPQDEIQLETIFGRETVQSVDYRKIIGNIGGRKDILIIFSGHQQTGTKGAEAIYHYIMINGKLPDGVIFLGLEDNQNLTEFNDEFVIRQKTEYQMYYNELKSLGLPKEWLDKLAMVPTDTDTMQNIGLLINTLKKYGLDNVNLYFVSYPVYQLRVATEFAFGLNQREDAPNCHLFIANIAPKKFENFEQAFEACICGDITQKEFNNIDFDDVRILSYDKPEMQLFDLSLANCVAHLYREHGKTRYAIAGLDKYPKEFKALAPLGLGYSYPNVVNELCGTDEKVAGILKIMRTLMLDEHDCGLSGAEQDVQQQWYVAQMGKKLLAQGLTTKNILKNGYNMTIEEFLEELGK